MMRSRLLLGIAWALAVPGIAHADDSAPSSRDDQGVWRLSTGVNYSEGDYGELQDTKVVSVPLAIKYKRGRFSVRVSVPYVHIDGPGSLLDTPQGRDAGFGDTAGFDDNGGSSGSGSSGSSGSNSSGSGSSGSGGSGGGGADDGGVSSGGVTGGDFVPVIGPATSRGGIGDISVSLGYALPLGAATSLDLSSRIKIPTASTSKRLGTGQVDVTVGAELVQEVGDLSVWAGARHRFLGKPAGSTLRDTWGAGGGLSYKLPGGTFIGADYDWQESARPGRSASSEVTGWINFGLTKAVRLQLFASTGLNASSTDFAGGLSLSVRLN